MSARSFGILLLLPLLLPACAGTGAEAPARTERPAEKSSPRLFTLNFVDAINAPDPQAAGAMVHWETYVAQDAKLTGMAELLRRRYASQPDSSALDRPIFKDTTVTCRELMDSKAPERLLGTIIRRRFEKEVQESYAKATRTCEAELMAFHTDIRATHASIRMPNGNITEFKVIHREARYWLVPLW